MRSLKGLTLLEMLVALALLGSVMALGLMGLGKLRGQLNLESAAEMLAQDLQSCRARGLSTGNPWRLRVSGSNAYVLEEQVSGSWVVRQTRALTGAVRLSNVAVGNTVSFDTRSYMTLDPGTLEVRVTDGARTLRVLPSMAGAVRVVKL